MRHRRIGPLSVALLAWALASLSGASALASVGVTVVSPPHEAGPGEFVTHVFSLTNDAGAAITFGLRLYVPSGWTPVGVPSDLALDPGESATLFVTVSLPAGALAGQYAIVLHAEAEADPTNVGRASAAVTVRPRNAVALLLPSGASVVPGDEVRYEVTVANRGNAQDSFQIGAVSASGFDATANPSLISLAPQEKAAVAVRVQVPTDASPGRDVLSVTASSTVYPGVTDRGTLFTTILPPPPQAVDGTLLEELPAEVHVSLGQDVLGGPTQSSLSFSLSGLVGEGYFSASVEAAPLFGPTPLAVSSFSLSYRRSPATYGLGDVSQRLTDLLALTCRGASVQLDAPYARAGLLAGEAGGDARFGAAVAVGPTAARLGIGHLERRSGTDQDMTWSLFAASEPLADVRLRLEGGVGLSRGLSSRAVVFNATVDTTSYFASLDAFSVGTHFPGLLADQAGVGLSQRLRGSAFSFAASLAHRTSNVDQDPLVPTVTTDDLGLNASLFPGDEWPTAAATLEVTWAEATPPAASETLDRLASLTLARAEGAFPYTLSAEWRDTSDALLGTHVRTISATEGAGITLEGLYLFLTLVETDRVDLVTGTPLAGGTDVSLTLRPRGALHSADLTWTSDRDVYRLSLRLDAQVVEALHAVFSVASSWDRTSAAPPTLECGITFDAAFDLPVPFLVTKGRIEGRVFVDDDRDGQFDSTEHGVDQAVVAAGQSQVSTDATGRFRFPPLGPGSYALDVSGLAASLSAQTPPQVALQPGSTLWVDVPVVPVATLSGVLFDDPDRSGAFASGDGGFADVRILLQTPDGVLVDETRTDSGGRFEFRNLRPGPYAVGVDSATLPERFGFTTPSEVAVTAQSGTASVVYLGGYVKPKSALITFQPPTADFSLTPPEPRAGTAAHFDASLSIAFAAEIVLYEWDFDGDGKRDAVGEAVDHTFAAPGTYRVTLTVTDSLGNSDAATTSVVVR